MKVRECTEVLLPRVGEESSRVVGQLAQWRFDWMMLATVFAGQLDVLKDMSVNSKGYITLEGIRVRFENVQSDTLKELLCRMLVCDVQAME